MFSAPAGSQRCSLNALWDVALSQRETSGRAQVPNSKSECWEKQFTDGTEDKSQGHSGAWQILYTWVILDLAVLDTSAGEFARSILGTVLGRWFGDREEGKRAGQGVTSKLREQGNS